ncbi:MAG: hypothetical protein CL931_12415 [Deltaproteobacteria bacterium]|nr:hypothetical protein [Deltaproteobacteria bacterium]
MSPTDANPIMPLPRPTDDPGGLSGGTLIAVVGGLVIGLLIVFFGVRQERFAGLDAAEIAIRINDLGLRLGRDVLVPTYGWTMQVELPDGLPESVRDTLKIEIREERTGAIVEITDRFRFDGLVGTTLIAEDLGLIEGLFSVRATLVDADEQLLQTFRRQRIRTWLGGPPIGSRQIVHFDFDVDRDGDGRADFEADLEGLGLLARDAGTAAGPFAEAIADRALARVRRAYDRTDDPNRTGRDRDQVFVRFEREIDDGPLVTRICIGGRNATHPDSIGFVRYDPHNSIKGSEECIGTAEDGSDAGLFPAAFSVYADDPLWGDAFGPLIAAPFGSRPGDTALLATPDANDRARVIATAIARFGDALGTVMSHESAHALGLVPTGKPSLGLFAGDEQAGEAYAHNLTVEDTLPGEPWLMNPGGGFTLADLTGQGAAGELRFRPLNWAYLKDRVVLKAR